MLSFNIDLDSLWQGLVDTNPEPTAELDTSKYVGNIFINIAQAAGGSDTLVITVLHATSTGGSFSAVPASALFNVGTGAADTFDNIVADATDQTLGLNRQQLKRFLLINFAGKSTGDNNVSVVAAGQPGYTEQF